MLKKLLIGLGLMVVAASSYAQQVKATDGLTIGFRTGISFTSAPNDLFTSGQQVSDNGTTGIDMGAGLILGYDWAVTDHIMLIPHVFGDYAASITDMAYGPYYPVFNSLLNAQTNYGDVGAGLKVGYQFFNGLMPYVSADVAEVFQSTAWTVLGTSVSYNQHMIRPIATVGLAYTFMLGDCGENTGSKACDINAQNKLAVGLQDRYIFPAGGDFKSINAVEFVTTFKFGMS